MSRTFLLGVGAQKAGTTWLHRYLRGLPDCQMGPVKEYAVFDALFRPDLFQKRRINRLRRLQALTEERLAALEAGRRPPRAEPFLATLDPLAMDLEPERYVPHFDRLWAARPGVRLVGDITPEYGALEAGHFARIRELLEAGGYRVKVVFLMRDPLERCFSALRMADREAAARGQPPARAAHQRFARGARSEWCEIRTRYDRTIPALEAAFPPEDIFYGFFETFFAPEPLRELTRFLGIGYRPPEPRRINATPQGARPDPEALDLVARHYAPTYAFCRARFGAEAIDAIWPNGRRCGAAEGPGEARQGQGRVQGGAQGGAQRPAAARRAGEAPGGA